jgi:hypothetical protein
LSIAPAATRRERPLGRCHLDSQTKEQKMIPHVLTLRTRASAHVLVLPSRRAARVPLEDRIGHSPRGAIALARLLAGDAERATVGSLTVQLEAA